MAADLNRVQLNKEGANAIREFADSMSEPLSNIMSDTEALYNVYRAVADNLGVHAEEFEIMLNCVLNAQENATLPIEALQLRLYGLAEKIDEYVDRKPDTL